MSKPELKDGTAARPNSPPLAKTDKKPEDDSSSDSFQHIAGDAKSPATAAPRTDLNGKEKEKIKEKDKDGEKKKPEPSASPADR